MEIRTFVKIGIKIPNSSVKMLPPLWFVKRFSWLPYWFPFNSKLDYMCEVKGLSNKLKVK